MAAVVLEEQRGPGGASPRRTMRPLARVAAPLLAALSGGAAAIHLTVVPEHLSESRRMGIFFLTVAWAQAAWALAIVLRPPTRRALTIGALLNGAVLAVWVMHHTVGIPFGLAGDHRHPVAANDVTCAILEALLVAAVVAIFALGPNRKVPTASLAGIMSVLGAGALFASGLAILSPASGTAAVGHTHTHGTVTQVPPTAEERHVLAQQLVDAREVAMRYPTVADAEAAGYRRAGPFSPGAGAHYVKMDGTGTNSDGAIDFEHPLAYLYDGTSETSEVVGVMYYSLAKDAPQGFAGPNDVWHQHSGACLVHNARRHGRFATGRRSGHHTGDVRRGRWRIPEHDGVDAPRVGRARLRRSRRGVRARQHPRAVRRRPSDHRTRPAEPRVPWHLTLRSPWHLALPLVTDLRVRWRQLNGTTLTEVGVR